MSARLAWIAVAVALAFAVSMPDGTALARGGRHGSYHATSSHSSHSGSHSGGHTGRVSSGRSRGSHATHFHATASHGSSVRRDSNGRIHRSQSAKKAFLHQHGLTHVPKGQQVDHRVPLCAGGSDAPSNMQLISTSAHRAKTRGDVRRCRRR